jgi:hypothetical protein
MADEALHHVIVGGGETSATEEAAAASVATAGAAVALAHEVAAHAELQAAEEVAEVREEIAEEGEAWRTNLESLAAAHGASLQTLNERLSVLSEREDARHKSDEQLNARLAEIESLLRPSTLPDSEGEEASEDSSTAKTQEAPLVGTQAGANLGPAQVSGEASLGETAPEPAPSPSVPRRAPRRWI